MPGLYFKGFSSQGLSIRLKLNESPVFPRMKSQGKGSRAPLIDSFLKYPNNKRRGPQVRGPRPPGATAGQDVVWYTGQFDALFFLLIYLKLDFKAAGLSQGDKEKLIAQQRIAPGS